RAESGAHGASGVSKADTMTAIGAMKTPSTERGCMPQGAKNELTSFGRLDDCASTSPFVASSTKTRPLLDNIHTWPFSIVAVPTWRPGGGGVNRQSSAPVAASNPTTGNPTSGTTTSPSCTETASVNSG